MPTFNDGFGLVRPIVPSNFFQSTKARWLHNEFWMPEGPLVSFAASHFDTYAETVVATLRPHVPNLKVMGAHRPSRYLFVVGFTPVDLTQHADKVPAPPVVTLQAVLEVLAAQRGTADEEDMLSLLSLLKEDTVAPQFKALCQRFPWVPDYLR